MRRWKTWEQQARIGINLKLEEAELAKDLGGSWARHILHVMFAAAWGGNVNIQTYKLLRLLFK
jgi:hypothetical protein